MSQKRALITAVDVYMGAAIKTRFESLGIEVVTGSSELITEAEIVRLVEDAGRIDILVANLDSERCNHRVAPIIPLAGGWVT